MLSIRKSNILKSQNTTTQMENMAKQPWWIDEIETSIQQYNVWKRVYLQKFECEYRFGICKEDSRNTDKETTADTNWQSEQ